MGESPTSLFAPPRKTDVGVASMITTGPCGKKGRYVHQTNGLFTRHGRGTGTGNGKNGLLYIMLYCSHCTRNGNGNGTGKLYNGLWTHFSVPDLCPGDVL